MSLEVKVPTVGESITEVTIAKWHKKSGDTVALNDLLCELESDKATFELNAESAGVLEIVAKEGDTVPIGAIVCKISEAKVDGSQLKVESKKEENNKQSTISSQQSTPKVLEVKVPTVGESITEVTLANWLKKDGEMVKQNDVLCELESDKATFELNAGTSGILRTVAKQGDVLPIGALICKIEESSVDSSQLTVDSKKVESASESTENRQPSTVNYAAGHASPAAAKILAEKGINSSEVKGTGVDGRITKEDAANAQKVQATTVKSENVSVSMGGNRESTAQKMSPLRKTVARRLVAVKNETAMLTTFNEVDMKPIMELRAKYKDAFKEKHGVGLGFMSFFTKACCVALQEFPAVNAQINGDEIIYNNFCDV